MQVIKDESITSFKGFNKNWKCRDFQYEVGKEFKHKGKVEACASGFHACEYPLDVFNYYPPAGSRFAIVKQSGSLMREGGEEGGDTKVASKSITITEEINLAGLVKAAVEYTTSRCAPVDPESPTSTTDYNGATLADVDKTTASASGKCGVALATGYQAAASATGEYGAAKATDDRAAASATGDQGAALATGYQAAASATGDQGAALATGVRGTASATGGYGAASATGDHGAALATGYQAAASSAGKSSGALATGLRGTASSTGDCGAASATGDRGTAQATGKSSVALATGCHGRAMSIDGGAIVLVHRNDDGHILHIRASKVGENGIKEGVWYMLDASGEFVEAAVEESWVA